jgi:UDP-glucose 4-epimerase
MEKILVTGGLGYIGSHTVVALQEQGYQVVIIDNLSNTRMAVLDQITQITGVQPEFKRLDLRDKAAVQQFFQEESGITGVIHFAASKAVGESVANPLLYYENNIATLVYLLQELERNQIAHFIFSSSCTVYGQADELPITESAPVKKAMSPYGNTKQIGEEIIQEFCAIQQEFNAISLRYFNPVGAHKTGLIGELPIGVPQNLLPYITQTAIGKRDKLTVFGADYPTPDGTCLRDYIHVVDVADAHVVALDRLMKLTNKTNYEFYNLGTGKGSSVLEVIHSFERMSKQKITYSIGARRAGDVTAAFADTSKANTILGWKTSKTLDDATLSAWNWEQKINKK